jgi:hypothetical protein
MAKIDRIEMETELGMAEAVRQDAMGEWLISHPWGDKRFAGSAAEVKSEMKKIIAENEANDAKYDEENP